MRSLFTATGVAAAVGEARNLRGARNATLVISGLTVETIAVTSRVGAVVGTGPPAVVAAGTFSASAALTNGTFALRDLAVDALIFTKSAGAEAVTLTLLAT
jgi:hypothetical protein